MASRKKCPECKQDVPPFMATYADMVTLLLTFFVLLFTVAKIDGREFRLILSAFKGSLGFFEGGQTLSKGKLEEMGMTLETLPSTEEGRALSKAVKVATEVFKPEVKTKRVRIIEEERGLVISLIGSDNFEPGSARLTEQIKRTLVKVAKLLRTLDAPVRIEGHTSERPVATGRSVERYETNWELASQRAINVLRYLHDSEDVDPEKMSATTYGKYRAISSSDTPEGRAINRRIDIVILKGKKYKRSYHDSDLPSAKISDTELLFK